MSDNLKIKDGDSYEEAVWKMSGGNPGAAVAMSEMSKEARSAGEDPLSPLQKLDRAGLYDSDVWMFYKDVCEKNASRCLGLLGDLEAGAISKEQLIKAVRNRGEGLVHHPSSFPLKKPKFGDDGYGGGGRGTGLAP